MIEENIGDAFHRPVPRDGDRRQGHRLTQQSIHGYEPFDAALQQYVRIAVQKFLVVVVRYREKEEVLQPEIMLDPADDHCGIGICEIARDHPDRVGALNAQRSCQLVGTVIELARRSEYSLFGALRNGTRRGGIIQDRGYRSGGKSHALRNRFQSDGTKLRAFSIFRTAVHRTDSSIGARSKAPGYFSGTISPGHHPWLAASHLRAHRQWRMILRDGRES